MLDRGGTVLIRCWKPFQKTSTPSFIDTKLPLLCSSISEKRGTRERIRNFLFGSWLLNNVIYMLIWSLFSRYLIKWPGDSNSGDDSFLRNLSNFIIYYLTVRCDIIKCYIKRFIIVLFIVFFPHMFPALQQHITSFTFLWKIVNVAYML